ncbi:DUF862-domain-containing protein [Amylocystis lapponica]|nr:DUF862-domain-containing protein [Amylocystis lapponica]
MSKVQLYVYDLSNGLARQLSLQLTGKQIDGIWHTSIVVFGKEIFYGQGICTTLPGQSHHGKPLQIVDMGETALDEDTLQEYLTEMSSHYTADKYHLLDFNCNSFTNDCVGFLTGNSIPGWIKDLPSDFLSTPFGAALRPTIDAMFRRPVPGALPTPSTFQPSSAAASAAAAASPNPALASTLLQAVASQALSSSTAGSLPPMPTPTPMPSTSTLTAPVHICSNPASFHDILRSHRAVIAFFTSATCGPCRMISPLFEDLALQKTRGVRGATETAFAKIDMGIGLGGQVGAEWGVRVTPTFIFFLDGKKMHEFKGANSPELRTQTDLLLFQAFPPHPHTSLSLPCVEALSTNPILFTQVPALDSVLTKLLSSLDASPPPEVLKAKQILTTLVLPFLKARFPPADAPKRPTPPSASPQLLTAWAEASRTLSGTLPPAQLFPLVDMWRLALLDDAVGSWCASAVPHANPVHTSLIAAATALESAQAGARNFILVALRMLANTFACAALVRSLFAAGGARALATRVLVSSLLHADAAVRTAAASVAFNVAAFLQKGRIEGLRGASVGGEDEDGEWEVEMVSAVLEALSKEVQSEEVVHRLTAALAFLLRLSPVYESQLASFLEVLQARETLKAKLLPGGCGQAGVQKTDIRKLIEEVAGKLCP